jgi:Domain of unknown function (DUF4307)
VTDLAQRYGAPGRMRRPLLVSGIVLLVAAGLGWLAWAIIFQTTPAVNSQLVAFTVTGEHSADATFTVVRSDRDVAASCLLQAMASDHSVVGDLNVRVGRSAAAEVTLRKAVRTERRATTVVLVGCTAAGQKQPR